MSKVLTDQTIKNKQTKYRLDPNADVSVVILVDIITIAPILLKKMFGEPPASDGYKVSGEYMFVKNSTKEVFTIYDYKETSLYDNEYPTPEQFWNSDKPEHFSVGGRTNVNEFIDDIMTVASYIEGLTDGEKQTVQSLGFNF